VRLSKQFAARNADDTRRSVQQLLTTLLPFVALLAVMAAVMEKMYWLSLLLAIPTAGLLVRLFIFQHDCGHGSFFRTRVSNDLLGRFLSIFTLTPYDYWKRSHAMHHATSGNLDKRGAGDVPTITVNEYLALSPINRLGYRLFRNPIVMILIGAPVNFIVLQRLPLSRAFRDPGSLRSIMGLNLMLLVVFGSAMAFWGVAPVLAVYLPVITIGACIGGWLFYIQHQFEGVYWERHDQRDPLRVALEGSSYYKLPKVLQWFTGNIGLPHSPHPSADTQLQSTAVLR